jgi:hypothetical protein
MKKLAKNDIEQYKILHSKKDVAICSRPYSKLKFDRHGESLDVVLIWPTFNASFVTFFRRPCSANWLFMYKINMSEKYYTKEKKNKKIKNKKMEN